MSKTAPIGVRFDYDLFETVKGAGIATTHQKALSIYEKSYMELINLKIAENNKPENKAIIEAERAGIDYVALNDKILSVRKEVAEISEEKKPSFLTPVDHEKSKNKRIMEVLKTIIE